MKRSGMLLIGMALMFLLSASIYTVIKSSSIKVDRVTSSQADMNRKLGRALNALKTEWFKFVKARDKGNDCSNLWIGLGNPSWVTSQNYSWSGNFSAICPSVLGDFSGWTLDISTPQNTATGTFRVKDVGGDKLPLEGMAKITVPLDEFSTLTTDSLSISEGTAKVENGTIVVELLFK